MASDRPSAVSPAYLESIRKAIQEGRFERALARIVRGRRRHPEDQELDTLEGICRADMGDYARAVSVLGPMLDGAPGQIEGRGHLVLGLARLGRMAEAEKCARRILGCPETGVNVLLKAAEGMTSRRRGLARLLVKAAIKHDGREPLCWLAWRSQLELGGHFEAAEAALARALHLAPGNPFVLETAFWDALAAERPAVALSHAIGIPPGHFKSAGEVAEVIFVASMHFCNCHPFMRGLWRHLRALKRSRAGRAQALIDAAAMGVLRG